MNDPSDTELEEDRRALDAVMTKIGEEDEGSDGDPAEQLAAAELAQTFYL